MTKMSCSGRLTVSHASLLKDLVSLFFFYLENLSFVMDLKELNPQLRILASIRVDTNTENGTEKMKYLKNDPDPLVDAVAELLREHSDLAGIELDAVLTEPEHMATHVALLKVRRMKPARFWNGSSFF